jgi:chaperonin cofactor prefoldin
LNKNAGLKAINYHAMKKNIVLTAILLPVLLACNQTAGNNLQLQKRIDSLEQKLTNTYKPGFGEFMSGLQMHHAKLWFAGLYQNWKLADFEIHEIGEALDDIQKFNTDRPETKSIGMLIPAIDSLNKAILQKDTELFRKNFTGLTNTCNNCHKATEHEFNVVTIPTALPVVNQDFKPLK